jgi:hypothetical protein
MPAQPGQTIVIPIEFQGDIPAVYANNVLIQHTDNEFIFTFFEILPPLLSPDPDRQDKEIAEIDSIPARAVAKIIMAPKPAFQFQEAIQDNISKFIARNQANQE